VNLLVSEHAKKQALERGGISSIDKLLRLWRKGKVISPKQAHILQIGNDHESDRIIKIKGGHILVAVKENLWTTIVTYIRKPIQQPASRRRRGRLYYRRGRKYYSNDIPRWRE